MKNVFLDMLIENLQITLFGNLHNFINIYYMKFLERFNRFKKETYRFTDIHKESYNNEELKFMLLHKSITDGFKLNLHKNSNYKHKFPPVELEQKMGIIGLSQDYNIPLNLTEAEYESLAVIFKEDSVVINFLFDELLKANPMLNIFKNTNRKFNVIDGVTSKIRIEDIKDYIEHSANVDKLPSKLDLRYIFKRNDGNDIQYQNIWNSLVEAGAKPNWFPSIETMNYIYQKVKKTI